MLRIAICEEVPEELEQVRALVEQATEEYAAEPLLNDFRFLRPHHSYLVNMYEISAWRVRDFVLHDGSRIPIARANAKETKQKYIPFLLQNQ